MSKLSMKDPEKCNYNWIESLVTDIISEGLRNIFKQEWNNHYRAIHGPWDDNPTSGAHFLSKEIVTKIPQQYLPKFQDGNTEFWDSSALCHAILKTKSIGINLSPSVKNEVENLKAVRNRIQHAHEARLSETEFQVQLKKVETSFTALGLSTNGIVQIREEKSRYTSFQDLPPRPTHDVVCRADLMSKLCKDLMDLFSNNQPALTYLYISGNPGSGKSELARQVCEELYSKVIQNPTEITFVMTVNANDLDSLMKSYVKFGRRLNCDEKKLDNITKSAISKENKILRLKSLIAPCLKFWKRWLVVVDNVENLAQILPLLPNLGEVDWNNGQIIVTTQDCTSIPCDGELTKHTSVSAGMHPQECWELLRLLSETTFDDQELDKVATKLDRQPLAIAAAAVYFRQVIESKSSPRFSWSDFLKKIEDGKRKITEERLGRINSAYNLTMSVTVALAVEKSAENEILDHAFYFFSLVSFELLPVDIIIKYIQGMNPDLDREHIGLKISLCSLFLPLEDKHPNVRVHRVVYQAFCDLRKGKEEPIPSTRSERKKKEENELQKVENAAQALYCFKDRDDTRKLIPHLTAFHACLKELYPRTATLFPVKAKSKAVINELCLFFGIVLRDFCEYDLSVEFLQAILQIWKGSKMLCVAISYDELGMLYRVQGRLQKAQEHFQLAKDIRSKTLGPNDVSIANSYNKIGSVHRCLGKLKQAKEHYESALKIFTSQLGPNNVDAANSYNCLGVLKHDLGELKEARDLLEQALEIRVEKLGESHVDVASSYHNLGALFHEIGDLKQAEDYYKRALEMRTELLGPNHATIATSYSGFGALYRDLGDFERANDYHSRALNIRADLFDEIHVNIASSCDSIGKLKHDMGALEEAEESLKRGLSIRIQKLGKNHLHVASSHDNLGVLYHSIGKLELAEQFLQHALNTRIEQLGLNHFHVATSYFNFGKLLLDLGKLEKAEKFHINALEIRMKQLGQNHFQTANSYDALGQVYAKRGGLTELQKAAEYYEKALNIRTTQFGPSHFAARLSCKKLGKVYEVLGDQENAERIRSQLY